MRERVLVVGALRIACNGMCTAARFHAAEENPGCLLRRHDGLDCIRHYNRCPALFESLRSLWLGTSGCIAPTPIFNELLFKVAVRSDRLCIYWLLDSLTPSSLLITCKEPTAARAFLFAGLCTEELK